jgi:acetoin utilization deacetylase AcuC-like enzyme/ankyrin repeat protein
MSTPAPSDDESFDPYSDLGPRYPIHDAVEEQTAEVFRGMIFVPRSTSDSDSNNSGSDDSNSDDGTVVSDSSSGTDGERDSAFAQAAAMGVVIASPSSPTATPAENDEENEANVGEASDDADIKDDSAMDADTTVSKLSAPASPEKATECENLENISPVKFDSNSEPIQELTSNIKELASAIVNNGSGVGVDDKPQSDEAMEIDQKREFMKKPKKKKRRKIKSMSYYCPHDVDLRDPDGNTPLHIAIHCRKLEHMKLLLEAGAQPNSKCDHSPHIHTAISIGSITAHKNFAYEAVDLLCNHGADLAARDDSSHTPLYLATMYNIPSVAGLLLNDPIGIQTLNMRSDRSGGRPLHAAARFNTSKGKTLTQVAAGSGNINSDVGVASRAIMTQMLLNTPGIEVDVTNNYGRSPLHIAASRGNWQVVSLLLAAGANAQLKDQRGLTAGLFALKKGMAIPIDQAAALGLSTTPPTIESIKMPPKRDLIIDPESSTFLICHELCSQHLTCPPITRNAMEPPPENVRRLSVLLDEQTGILRSAEFDSAKWEGECRRASMADVLKVHEYKYVENISQVCSEIPDHRNAIAHLDSDTGLSRWSFEAAMRAAGSVCEAVDRVLAGDFRNAFCAVRPPGHHSGPRGIVKCELDPEGSHGFCLLNNVAIGAAYARSMYRNDGIKKIAIIDFDVHHGNGTEAVIRNLVPSMDRATIRLPFALGTMETPRYRPWLDETDVENVFFASAHGYGPRQLVHQMGPHPGWFYPSSGRSFVAPSVHSPGTTEIPSVEDFIMTQSWAQMGEESRNNCCKVINVGLNLPVPGETPGMQRVETRDAYRKNILPHLLDFDPDIIFISAGFDAHKRDEMNFGYVGMVEEDYEWVTEQLIKVANTCCNGRIISVLEGGYRIHGGIVSPFARSVASHVRGLMDGGNSRELYDRSESEWESRFEREMIEERERKRQIRMERLTRPYGGLVRRHAKASESAVTDAVLEPSLDAAGEPATINDLDALMQMPIGQSADQPTGVELAPDNVEKDEVHEASTTDEGRPTKRKRNAVDYKELLARMKKEEGLA